MKFLISALLIVLSPAAFGRVDIKTTKPMIIPVDNVTPTITQKDVAEVVPTDMKAEDSSSSIFSRIMDRGFNYWYKNSEFKNSAVGRAAEDAQQKLKTDVVVPAKNKGGVNHKFSFRVEAFQTMAKMEYTGWTNAAVKYNAAKAETNFEVSEKVFKNKALVVSHSVTSREGVSSVGMKWSW
jgi:hypothetical protein